mmetsp:Transcript_17368/g.32956  ORF Transcript_17368/g.32956 Transcript_17368/m.32956 type:complete len:201 (-) Transcript_17368:123-725(-)
MIFVRFGTAVSLGLCLACTRTDPVAAQLGAACASETQSLLQNNFELAVGGTYVGGAEDGCENTGGVGDLTVKCTLDGSANATAYQAACEQVGGQYLSVTYNIVCRTTSSTGTITSDFDYRDYNVCLGTSCDQDDAEEYLKSSESTSSVPGITTTCTTTGGSVGDGGGDGTGDEGSSGIMNAGWVALFSAATTFAWLTACL